MSAAALAEVHMKTRSLTLLALGLSLASVTSAQRTSFAAIGGANFDYAPGYFGMSSGYSDTGALVNASIDRQFTGLNQEGETQTMRFVGSSSAQSDFGRLKTKVQGSVSNMFYGPNNDPYYDGTSENPEGIPDSFLVSGTASFTELLSFGGSAAAGYKARYVFFVHGQASGSNVKGLLHARIGAGNPLEELIVRPADSPVARYWSTQAYTISSLMNQEANVTFTNRFDVSTFNYADGTSISGAADFSSTITLAAVNVYDQNDNLVAGATVTGSSGTTYSTAPVPEPATFAALGLGAAAILRRRRRR